jgi:parallel beta-helix repeat protein
MATSAGAIVRDNEITDCVGNSSINVGPGSLVADNVVRGSHGMALNAGSVARGNVVSGGVSGGGIRAAGSQCRIEDNHLIGNTGVGVTVDSSTSNTLVVRNHAVGNSAGNYSFLGTVIHGPLVTTTGVTTNHPWANFSF